MNLDPKKKKVYDQFDKKCGHLVPAGPEHEHLLSKWLIARNFELDKAEAMLVKHLEWKKEWDLEHILDFEPPEVLLRYYPVGLLGNDDEGSPVFIVPFGYSDMRGILQSSSKKDYIKYTMRNLEVCFREMATRRSKNGEKLYTVSVIFDLDGFTLGQFTWRPAMDALLDLIKIYEANFPEILKFCLAINAPKVFSIAYNVVKPFLHEVTISKIRIFGRSGWQEEIKSVLPVHNLPKHYGGKLVDPNGDPKCPSKLCMGGPVPKSYYLKNRRENINSEGFSKMIVPQGGKRTLVNHIDDAGTMLSWDFQTEDFDIGFSIHRKTEDSDEDEVLLPMTRVNCQLVPEQGTILCTEPGDYIVTFDNEFSYIRTKEILYKIDLSSSAATTKM